MWPNPGFLGACRRRGFIKNYAFACAAFPRSAAHRHCAARWLQAYEADAAAPVVLASTNERALEVIPLEVLRVHSVDVPADPSSLE